VSGARLTIPSGNDQKNRTGVSARVTDLGLRPYAPPATDLACDIGSILLTNVLEGNNCDLSPSGRPEPPKQYFQIIRYRGLEQFGEVVHVSYRLVWNQRVQSSTLRSKYCRSEHALGCQAQLKQ
jgi:hypothetical protein